MSDEIKVERERESRGMAWHRIATGTDAMNTDAGCVVAKTVTSGAYKPSGVGIVLLPGTMLVRRWEVKREGNHVTAYWVFKIARGKPTGDAGDPFAWHDADAKLPKPTDEQIVAKASEPCAADGNDGSTWEVQS